MIDLYSQLASARKTSLCLEEMLFRIPGIARSGMSWAALATCLSAELLYAMHVVQADVDSSRIARLDRLVGSGEWKSTIATVLAVTSGECPLDAIDGIRPIIVRIQDLWE